MSTTPSSDATETPDNSIVGWDWDTASLDKEPPPKREKPYLLMLADPNETPYDRKLRMLEQLRKTCMACTMCELGRKPVSRDGKIFVDPHVLSNLNPTRFMVVGQNPGYEEVRKCQPFVGQSGRNFDVQLTCNGLQRSDFYICNTVRCYTAGNARPNNEHVERCRPFLQIEINLIRPLLVIALGGVAFEQLCPHIKFSDALGDVTQSKLFNVPVFAIYHPSPLNLADEDRNKDFKKQMRVMCGVVKRLKAK